MEKTESENGEKNGKITQSPRNIREINRFFTGDGNGKINFKEIVAVLPKSVREMITSGFDMKTLAKIFEDESMMQTAKAYLEHGMNISETARNLYMHRNTLMYRLNNLRKLTGLDLSRFDDAVTFALLHGLYLIKG